MEKYPVLSIDEKLDLILDLCKARLRREYSHDEWHEVIRKVCEEPNEPFDSKLFWTYIQHLVDELEFVKHDPTLEGESKYGQFRATIKGLAFEGFVKQKEANVAENIRLEKLEIFQKKMADASLKQAEQLSFATWILAGGTVALVLIEVWKLFNQCD